jgi:uncharacterized protein YegL
MVLDMSGSMQPQWDDTIGGANSYVDGLKEDKNTDYLMTIVNFDTAYEVLCANRPLSEVPKLDRRNYHPRGGTALYDALGRAIRETESRVLAGERAIVVIITDGEENSSVTETQLTIKPKVETLQGKGNWTFIYLGATPNAWSNAGQIGIGTGNTIRYKKSATRSLYKGLVGATQSYSLSNNSATMDFMNEYGSGLKEAEEDDE